MSATSQHKIGDSSSSPNADPHWISPSPPSQPGRLDYGLGPCLGPLTRRSARKRQNSLAKPIGEMIDLIGIVGKDANFDVQDGLHKYGPGSVRSGESAGTGDTEKGNFKLLILLFTCVTIIVLAFIVVVCLMMGTTVMKTSLGISTSLEMFMITPIPVTMTVNRESVEVRGKFLTLMKVRNGAHAKSSVTFYQSPLYAFTSNPVLLTERYPGQLAGPIIGKFIAVMELECLTSASRNYTAIWDEHLNNELNVSIYTKSISRRTSIQLIIVGSLNYSVPSTSSHYNELLRDCGYDFVPVVAGYDNIYSSSWGESALRYDLLQSDTMRIPCKITTKLIN